MAKTSLPAATAERIWIVWWVDQRVLVKLPKRQVRQGGECCIQTCPFLAASSDGKRSDGQRYARRVLYPFVDHTSAHLDPVRRLLERHCESGSYRCHASYDKVFDTFDMLLLRGYRPQCELSLVALGLRQSPVKSLAN
ncbi:hypothetical protein F442_15878 [Phytophthora nicotianae P10297]|uniref:Uncharacterized protein n=1 Tax=Phytophthora nicotianae P10297 TaxID=1317064 RepID=W2YPH2_PHYNI|nr:hypothetical protein F442_15878 [Phytophthora nicotianae P10297]